MTKVTLNIDKFTLIPMYWEFNNIREFTDFIRSEMFNILKYAQANFVSRSTLLLGIHIHEDCDDNNYFQWDFVISCKNIREFKNRSFDLAKAIVLSIRICNRFDLTENFFLRRQ